MNMQNQSGIFFLLLGPSGVGKGTVLSQIKEEWGNDERFHFPVTATTRKPRDGEENGIHYFFKEKPDFEQGVENGDFLEYAVVHGKEYYGLPKSQVVEPMKNGINVIRELDIQGLWNLQKILPSDQIRSIFLLPPSMEILEKRIRERSPLPEEEIARRLQTAQNEIENSKDCDFAVVSEEGKINECVIRVKNIILTQIRSR